MPYSLSLPDADVDIWRAHLDLIETSQKTCGRLLEEAGGDRRGVAGTARQELDRLRAEPYVRTLMALDDEAKTLDRRHHRRRRVEGGGEAMTRIKALRILPPFAIARLGSADEPMDNYTIEIDPPAANEKEPLGYRAHQAAADADRRRAFRRNRTRQEAAVPLEFKRDGQIRPVAPFLEVFAVTENDELVPLTVELLQENGFEVRDVSWSVSVANRKVARRTGDEDDVVATGEVAIRDHDTLCIVTLHGTCPKRFASADDSVIFGQARFIKPNKDHPEIRLRFTPAQGLIYGPKNANRPGDDSGRKTPKTTGKRDRPYRNSRRPGDVYDPDKGGIWAGYSDVSDDPDRQTRRPRDPTDWKNRRNAIWAGERLGSEYDNETVPPALFAIDPPAPSWLYDNEAVSRGYLDDACDGFVEVRIARPGEDPEQSALKATARICSAPPAMAPDSLFVRSPRRRSRSGDLRAGHSTRTRRRKSRGRAPRTSCAAPSRPSVS